MSVRFDASADDLHRANADVLSSTATFTLCMWAKRKVDTNAFAAVAYIVNSTSAHEFWFETETGGDVMHCFDKVTVESDVGPGPTMTTDTWIFVLYRRTNTARALLWGDESGGTLSSATNTDTRTSSAGTGSLYVGNDTFSENFNGELAYVRLWDASLSDAEADAEWRSTTPVRSSNLRGDWRLAAAASAGTDSSGNGLTLTVGGTLADGGANPTPPAASNPSFGMNAMIATPSALLRF